MKKKIFLLIELKAAETYLTPTYPVGQFYLVMPFRTIEDLVEVNIYSESLLPY